jgi:hypothetical protein
VPTALDVVDGEVRELIRRRGLDPFTDPGPVRVLVRDVVADYSERSLTSALPPIGDAESIVRDVLDRVAGSDGRRPRHGPGRGWPAARPVARGRGQRLLSDRATTRRQRRTLPVMCRRPARQRCFRQTQAHRGLANCWGRSPGVCDVRRRASGRGGPLPGLPRSSRTGVPETVVGRRGANDDLGLPNRPLVFVERPRVSRSSPGRSSTVATPGRRRRATSSRRGPGV